MQFKKLFAVAVAVSVPFPLHPRDPRHTLLSDAVAVALAVAVRMDQAVPVIPTFGTCLDYAPAHGTAKLDSSKYLDKPDYGNDPLETGQPSHQVGWYLWRSGG